MDTSKSASDFAPLLKALQQIAYQLELKGASRILVADANVKKFQRQELASHNEVTEHPFIGSRVPARGRHRTDQARIILARWPKDRLLEAALPTLLFVLSGQADIRVANYSVRCWPGDVIWVPAGVPKSDGSVPDYTNITPEASCDIMMFSPGLIYGQGLECSIGHSRGDKHISGLVDERCWVRNLPIAQLYSIFCTEMENKGNSKSTFHLLLLLLIQLQLEIKAGKAMVGWIFSATSNQKAGPGLINRAMKYIDDHLEGNLTIDIVAREVGVSRTILTREFRRGTNDTFKNYLINQRMKRAEVLLRDANLPVNKVSAQVGLSSERLRVLFRQKHQCSPDNFRDL